MSPGVTPLRHLGRLRLVSVGLNAVIGGGIFVLPAEVARLSGPSSLAAYLIAGLVVVGLGLTLGRLAAQFDISGGPYAYVQNTFGRFAGFQVGWLFCLARLTALANLLNGAALYLAALVPALAGSWARSALIVGFAAVIVLINAAGIRETSGAATMFAVLKVAPLVFVGAVGLLLMQPERLAPAAVAPDDFLRSVLLLLFAFTGFETLTVPAEEALRPRSDLPMALLVTIGSVCAIYVLVHAAALGGLPSLAVEKAPLASLAGALFGEGGRAGMTAVAAVSMVGCSLLSLFGATRLLYAMSAAGEIPPFLGALDPKRRTPVVGSLLTGGLGAVLAILGGYAFLAAVSSGLRLLMYVACCLACLGRAASGSWSWRVAPMLVLASILLLLTALERREVVFGMIGIGAGLGLYLAARLGSRGSMTRREAV